jgi:TolB-like protein/DNA-binding winged helix-turn-helix (wHTH) protein
MNDRFSADDLPRRPGSEHPRSPWPIDLAHIRPFRIGSVEVRPAACEVVGDGHREVLEPRVMQVLVALAGARGETLSRDDLITACWEGRAVSDDAVNRVISRLRALARTFVSFEVETITKVGYRLVEQAGNASTDFATFDPGQEPGSPGVPRRTLIAGGVAAAAAVGAGGWFAWTRYGAGARQASIAVLPFANLSGDPGRQYFADGMAEELRNALARIGRLKVIGRTSSESVRNVEARAAAKRLGVAHILLGSIRQSPTMVRVSAQLIDGSSGAELWSETYDRSPGDILAIQSDIAQSVALSLVTRLAPDERAALAAGGTTNATAHDLMLKAEYLAHQVDGEENQRKALGLLDAAIALDPQYADAHATRSLRLVQIGNHYVSSMAQTRAMHQQGVQAARRAVALAPNFAAGFAALAWALLFRLQFAGALNSLDRAYRLGRGDARTIRIYATILWMVGKTDRALKLVDESFELDPLHPRHNWMVGQVELAAGHYAKAAAASRRALEIAPTLVSPRYSLVTSLIFLGHTQEAQAELAKIPQGLRRSIAEAILFDRLGDRAQSDQIISAIKAEHRDLANYELAGVFAQRGDRDQALAMLDAAWRARDPNFALLAGDRTLDPLRGDPKFQAIVKQLNLPA